MIYVLWQKSEKEVAAMDVTRLVNQTMDIFTDLDRVVVANILMDILEADMIITADTEEQMISMFPNAQIVHQEGQVN